MSKRSISDHVWEGCKIHTHLPGFLWHWLVRLQPGIWWRHLTSSKVPLYPLVSNLWPVRSWLEQQWIPRRQIFQGHIFTLFVISRKGWIFLSRSRQLFPGLILHAESKVCVPVSMCACVYKGWLQWGGSMCVSIWMAGLILGSILPVALNDCQWNKDSDQN